MSRRRPLTRDDGRSATTTRARRRDAPRASAARRGPRGDKSSAPRRRGRRLLKVVTISVLVVASLGAAGDWVLRQPYFRVQHVTFVGLHHESRTEVLVASGLNTHPMMLDVNAATLQHNLARFTWISALSIVKHWPSTLVVTFHESTAVAVAFNARHVLQYVDATGRDLGRAPLHTNLATLQFTNPRGATWPFARAGRSAAYVASQLPPAFSSQVSVITEDSQGVVTFKMTTPVTFVLGPPTQLHAKFVAIASVIAHSTLRPGDVVDATVPDELAVTGPAPS